ncbi:MAG: hypothetical protein ABI746_11935 [Dermatophilaceae bacterium]
MTASAVPGPLPGMFTVTVQLSDGPLANARAQPGFTVQLHWQIGDSSWTPVPDHGEVETGTMTTSFNHASPDPATRLALILVDPVGREATPLMVDVTAG